MTPDRAAERAAYIAAFTAANGRGPEFTIDWENGWWVFGHAGRPPVRYRSAFLQIMTARLQAAAARSSAG